MQLFGIVQSIALVETYKLVGSDTFNGKKLTKYVKNRLESPRRAVVLTLFILYVLVFSEVNI